MASVAVAAQVAVYLCLVLRLAPRIIYASSAGTVGAKAPPTRPNEPATCIQVIRLLSQSQRALWGSDGHQKPGQQLTRSNTTILCGEICSHHWLNISLWWIHAELEHHLCDDIIMHVIRCVNFVHYWPFVWRIHLIGGFSTQRASNTILWTAFCCAI